MNIWQFQNELAKRLLRWSIFSMIAGLLMRFGNTFFKAVGGQFFVWGLIDAIIAVVGQVQKRQRIDQLENPGTVTVKTEEASRLSRLLWINAGLDVLYMLGGFLWMRRDKGDGQARGNGLGVVIQGGFLLIFDIVHALRVPKAEDDA